MTAPLQIAFKDTEASEAIEALVRDKVERLSRRFDRVTGWRVVISVPHRTAGGGGSPALGIAVEVQMPGRPPLIAKDAEEQSATRTDHAGFIGRAFDAIQRQLDDVADIRKAG